MSRGKRANGAGTVYIKHGSYYGRWVTASGGRANRKLGPVRRPGTASGLTRAQAEKRLRADMDQVEVRTDPDVTIATAGVALLAQLEARGSSKSHRETVESHLRVHLAPYFNDKSLDRIGEDDVTRLLVRLRRLGRAPKTIRNIASTLHSLFELAVRRGWVDANPCKQVDLPAAQPSADMRFLTHEELRSVLERGIPDGERAKLDRALYLTRGTPTARACKPANTSASAEERSSHCASSASTSNGLSSPAAASRLSVEAPIKKLSTGSAGSSPSAL